LPSLGAGHSIAIAAPFSDRPRKCPSLPNDRAPWRPNERRLAEGDQRLAQGHTWLALRAESSEGATNLGLGGDAGAESNVRGRVGCAWKARRSSSSKWHKYEAPSPPRCATRRHRHGTRDCPVDGHGAVHRLRLYFKVAILKLVDLVLPKPVGLLIRILSYRRGAGL